MRCLQTVLVSDSLCRHASSVTLSKNGSQVNVMPSHETGLLSCIRQERGAESHAKVINFQNWTQLSHDFCTASLTDT